MGLLKSPSSKPTPTSGPKKGITFAENGPEIIGYRDASDSEDEEEFFELSLKESSPTEKSSPTLDYDETDPERIKLRQLTEANTCFNSNYANFKLNDSGIGLGRSKPASDSGGPIKFVIQDGYQQPLPPTKYKSSNTANAGIAGAKKAFEGNVKEASSAKPLTRPLTSKPLVKPTTAPPPKPTTISTAKPIPETTSKQSSEASIPTIRIPRASIQVDKINRSPPPLSSTKPPPLLPEKPVIAAAKPKLPPKLPQEAEKKTEETPPTESQIKSEVITHHRNSVILLDETDGTILPLDSRKLPAELKDEDVVEQTQLYMITNKNKNNNSVNKESKNRHAQTPKRLDDCLSDSGSDSGASGCSPSSTSPTAQLLEEEDRSTPSNSPSPDSLDSSSPPDSYDLMKSEEGDSSDLSSRPSPVPPVPVTRDPSSRVESKSNEKSELLNTPIILPKVTLSSSSSTLLKPVTTSTTTSASVSVPKPPTEVTSKSSLEAVEIAAQSHPPPHATLVKSPSSQSSASSGAPAPLPVSPNSTSNPNNKTMISISYRRSSSQQSGDSSGPEGGGVKRNQMLAKLAMDLEQHRSDSSSSNLSNSGSVGSESSVSLSSATNNRPLIPEQPAEVKKPTSPIDQFIADCCEDDDELTNAKSGPMFSTATASDSETDSDSDCDPLPDMIKSDDDLGASSASEDSDDESNFGRRRASKESESKSSTSSLGSKNNNSKSVSAMFKNVVNSSNTKKYTKLMKKNLTKTSKFIVNKSKQLGTETTDMVKKFKDKSAERSTVKGDHYYYPEEYSEPKTKSKWTFSPNSGDNDIYGGSTDGGKKKGGVYSMARNAFRNIEGKISNHHSNKNSKGATIPIGTAELPIDPFGGSGAQSAETEAGAALLKIKRLDSSMVEPNYSEPNLLRNTAVPVGTKSESNLHKPPLPPRNGNNYRAAPGLPETAAHEKEPSTKSSPPPLPENPPQAPLRRKKLAKKRDQITAADVATKDSSIEMTIEPSRQEVPVTQEAPGLPEVHRELSLAQLRTDYESFYRVFKQNLGDSIEIFTNIHADSKLYRAFRCRSHSVDFYLLSSPITWTTVYDTFDPTNPVTNFTFQGEPCRYLPAHFTRFQDVSTFCQKTLNSETSPTISAETRGHLVDTLVLQLHSILAGLELRSKSGRFNRTIGDVNESIVGVAEGPNGSIDDVLLLLPTKEPETADEEGGDSLSMMQSFCLQVFLIRLTSMITNEDSDLGSAKRPRHYRNLVRRNQSGFSSLRDLYLLVALDIFKVLGSTTKKVWTKEALEKAISGWFDEQEGADQVDAFYDCSKFVPKDLLSYGEILFCSQKDLNRQAVIELAKKERCGPNE